MPYFMCVTGHRPDKLGGLWSPKLWMPALPVIKDELMAISRRVKDRVVVYDGLAQGFDLMVAAAVLQLIQEGKPFDLVGVQPFKGQTDTWKDDLAKSWYDRAVAKATNVVCLHDEEPGSRFKAIQWLRDRNFWMVDRASEVLSCCDMTTMSGTLTTVEHASQKGVPVKNIYPQIIAALGLNALAGGKVIEP